MHMCPDVVLCKLKGYRCPGRKARHRSLERETSEEDEVRITAQNVRLTCHKCGIAEQIIHVGGHQSGRVECRVCHMVLWKGRDQEVELSEPEQIAA